jgi:opacity protein-like surface antigen
MKKLFFLLFTLFFIAGVVYAEDGERKKAEFSLNFGGGFPLLDTSSSYADNWGIEYLLRFSVSEGGSIATKAKSGMFFGGSFAYYFSEKVGIQAGFGYLKADVTNGFSYTAEWEPYSDSAVGTDTGELTIIPININAIAKYSYGKLSGYFSGGYTFFYNKFNSNAAMGYAYWFPVGIVPILDAVIVDLNINESWTGHGINIGGGFDFKVSENIAITAEARTYYCPSKEFAWNWQTGRYEGFMAPNIPNTINFGNEDAQYASGQITSLEINPSFFQVSAGVKFFF